MVEGRVNKECFRHDLSILATQPAKGKGGDNCEGEVRRKEMRRRRREVNTQGEAC